MRKIKVLLWVVAFVFTTFLQAQEAFFAGYFDININEKEGTAVFGKINLKSNKDALHKAIPKSYYFEIEKSETDIFELHTEFDKNGRIFGVFKVAKNKRSGKLPSKYTLTVVLKDGGKLIERADVVINVVNKTMWQELVNVYTPITISTSRLYGRTKFSDKELEHILQDLEANNGRFSGVKTYTTHPSQYKNPKALDKDWEGTSKLIGGLGYAYAKSKKFGVKSGNKAHIERLKRAIYSATIQFTNAIPINGDELIVDGKPVGNEIGEGFSKNGFLSHGFLTHQWRAIDALGAPLVYIWPSVIKDIENGDAQAIELYEAVNRYYQLFFAIVDQRRLMDDETQRWKNISDRNYSEGAWADANISHRMRTLMVMPILWADYNRPITYVPYWYDDYFNGTKFEGLTFAKNWTPTGVVTDVRSWCDKLSLPSHMFNQSGFHPDGTVTHHSGHHASDVAMVAYGYEWLVTINKAIDYFKNTPYPVKDESYQFLTDRLNYTYRRMIYKNSLDFTVAGRSFYSDLSAFGSEHVAKSIKTMLDGKSATTVIENEAGVKALKIALSMGTHAHTETSAFWVADYLMHRREDANNNYFFSVKHKSVRTSGAEDFDKIRKSWHAGSGVFLLKVDGDEYNRNMKEQADWHVLPGVTEAWETDAMPTGAASASLPGGNQFSGVLANGTIGLAGFHHLPIDTYTSAQALKSTHMVGNLGVAVGSTIERKPSSNKTAAIVTCVDQSQLTATLVYSINGKRTEIKPGESVAIEETINKPMWLHHNNKGYLIFPKEYQKLHIKTGSYINVTDTSIKNNASTNYIIALDHGVKPNASSSGYNYVMVANVTKKQMPAVLKEYVSNVKNYISANNYHALEFQKEQLKQVVFYQAGTVTLNKYKVASSHPALIMLKDKGESLELAYSDPLHSLSTSEVTIEISEKLKEGSYTYEFPGIKVSKGETVTVNNTEEGSAITIQLPDSKDGELYNYKEQLFAGAPIVLTLAKVSTF